MGTERYGHHYGYFYRYCRTDIAYIVLFSKQAGVGVRSNGLFEMQC